MKTANIFIFSYNFEFALNVNKDPLQKNKINKILNYCFKYWSCSVKWCFQHSCWWSVNASADRFLAWRPAEIILLFNGHRFDSCIKELSSLHVLDSVKRHSVKWTPASFNYKMKMSARHREQRGRKDRAASAVENPAWPDRVKPSC